MTCSGRRNFAGNRRGPRDDGPVTGSGRRKLGGTGEPEIEGFPNLYALPIIIHIRRDEKNGKLNRGI